jgi:FixJ family two-component response regulator
MPNKRPLIAVVDDDQSVCKAIGRLIIKSNFDVVTVTSGQMLLDLLPVRPPDCILLDLHMPGLSGVDVLRALADIGSKLPVIVITGRDEPTARARCLAAGATAFLLKPLDPKRLLRAIGEALGGAPRLAN